MCGVWRYQENQWSEQLLEKYADKVDWHEVSGNNNMLWTASMLEKFKKRIDWRELSGTGYQCLLNVEILTRFEQYWDWHEIIARWDDVLFDEDFLERYKEYIPASELQHSRLWNKIVEKRKTQLANQITVAV